MAYYWRHLTESQRREVECYRRTQKFPKHSLPHFDTTDGGEHKYLLSGACYEHAQIIGAKNARMDECAHGLIEIFDQHEAMVYAWCVLPNHYHFLVSTDRMAAIRREIAKFNGRTAYRWNGEDDARGRKVWHNCFERRLRSERHFFACLNYVHHNPVKHGYVKQWQDWPWSSAGAYLESIGRQRASEIWRDYPILDMGETWDFD